MQNNTTTMNNNEIGLMELWQIIIKQKVLILVITGLTTVSAVIYVIIAKPIYSGSVMVEMGEVVNNNVVVVNNVVIDDKVKNTSERSTVFYLDNIYNLKDIISRATNTTITVPKKSTNILILSYANNDKELIKKKLEDAINFIMTRHKEKAELYKNNTSKIKITQIIGEVNIGNTPIKPDKKRIVLLAFLTGLIISIFVAFLLEFMKALKQPSIKEDR